MLDEALARWPQAAQHVVDLAMQLGRMRQQGIAPDRNVEVDIGQQRLPASECIRFVSDAIEMNHSLASHRLDVGTGQTLGRQGEHHQEHQRRQEIAQARVMRLVGLEGRRCSGSCSDTKKTLEKIWRNRSITGASRR
ncbi:hypothetical protein G6F22_020815 [Rhizopus arrhizus]|nr:hypothetical protein G6F22_020815 [Rhizopus arrhizus]